MKADPKTTCFDVFEQCVLAVQAANSSIRERQGQGVSLPELVPQTP